MKAKIIIAAAVIAASLSSCSSFKYHYAETRIADAGTDVFVIPPTVKVQVNPVSFSDSWVFEGKELKALVGNGATPDALRERLRIAATNKTLQKHEGDILVAPVFDIVSERDGHRYIVTIRGYVGTFTDWNKNSEEFLELQKYRLDAERQIGVYTR